MKSMGSECDKAKDLMSGAIDGELSAEEIFYFKRHIEGCEKCRNEFELEKITQAYFRKKVGLLTPPDDLLESIRAQLSYEDRLRASQPYLSQPTLRRYLWPALAIAMILVITLVAVFTKRPDKTSPEPSEKPGETTQIHDALSFSEQNFQDILNGEFYSQIKTQNPNDVLEFMKQNAGYSIPIPDIHDAEWIGGNVTMLKEEKIVNVAYKVGPSYIYIFAFPTTLAHSRLVSLPLECISELDKGEWFWGHGTKGDLQATWLYGDHVCVVTSNLDKISLLACLKTVKGISGDGWQ